MNLHFSYKAAKSPEIETEIQNHVKKLEQRLRAFRPDLVHLRGALFNGPCEAVEVSLNLRLPSGQITSHQVSKTPMAAVKAAFSDLAGQLKRHKEMLRNEHRWRRSAFAQPGTLAFIETAVASTMFANEFEAEAKPNVELLPTTAPRVRVKAKGNSDATVEEIPTAGAVEQNQHSRQEDLREYINVNLSRLERYVDRELRYRESAGELPSGLVTREEVIDEVIVTALAMEEHPPNLTLERWLYRLAMQAIRRLASGNSLDFTAVHLEQSAGTQNVSGSDESFLQYHQPEETLHCEDVIPDTRISNPEEIAASDELVAQLELALRGAKPAEREAFVLFVLEGFTIQEIAQITDRPSEQVQAGIVAVRLRLMKKLPSSNPLKQKLLRHSTVA